MDERVTHAAVEGAPGRSADPARGAGPVTRAGAVTPAIPDSTTDPGSTAEPAAPAAPASIADPGGTADAVGGGGVRTIHRALAALELLVDAAPRAVRVADVAGRLEVDPATASRLLATLVARGYASRTPARRYTVGPRSLRMATVWMERLRTASEGPMGRVSQATGETVMLSQLLGGRAVPIASRRPSSASLPRMPRLAHLPPGYGDAADGYPLWATAAGRALLAALPAAQRQRVLPAEPYPVLTERTPTAWPAVRDAVRAGFRDGVHFEQGEADPGLWCYAMPLLPGDQGEALAISIMASGDLGRARHARIMRVLRAESRAVSEHLTAST